jgi:outer membrane protein assembly factor BamB
MKTELLTCVMLALALQATGADWPEWRGPNRNGVSNEKGWSTAWPKDGPKELWKGSVGTGFSSFTVSDGRLFTMGHDQGTDTVYALDAAKGSVLWKHSYPASLDPNLYEGGPNATPTIHGGRVYTLGKQGQLFCFEAASGKIVWQKNLISDFGLKKPEWGFSSSPLIEGELILLNAGGAGTALKLKTGEQVWTSPGAAAYPTPYPFNLEGGQRAAIFLTRDDLVTVGVRDGKVLWKTPWKTKYDMGVPDAAAYGNKLFVSSWGEAGALIEFRGTEGHILWRNKDMWQHVASPVVLGDYAYGFHGDASKGKELKCLDLRDGKIKWTQGDLPNGALMAADGKLIILTGQGELIIAEGSPAGFRPLARAQVLTGKCWTAPVLANGRIYARNATGTLVCLDVSGSK